MKRTLIYLTEVESEQINKVKKDDLLCWCKVQGAQVIGMVSEESNTYALTTHGKRIIYNMVRLFRVNTIVIYSANELGTNENEICESLCEFMAMEVQVISLKNDLPDNPIYRGLQLAKRDNRCNVALMDWE